MGKSFNATSTLDLRHFEWIEVEYLPQNLTTRALQVTRENIGALALEFDSEIGVGDNNRFWIYIQVEREIHDGRKNSQSLCFGTSDWIVLLRGEIHRFPNDVFWSTFSRPNFEPAHLVETPPEPQETFSLLGTIRDIPVNVVTVDENNEGPGSLFSAS